MTGSWERKGEGWGEGGEGGGENGPLEIMYNLEEYENMNFLDD